MRTRSRGMSVTFCASVSSAGRKVERNRHLLRSLGRSSRSGPEVSW